MSRDRIDWMRDRVKRDLRVEKRRTKISYIIGYDIYIINNRFIKSKFVRTDL